MAKEISRLLGETKEKARMEGELTQFVYKSISCGDFNFATLYLDTNPT